MSGLCLELKTYLLNWEKFYTTFYLRSSYHCIAFDKDSIKKTAFVSPFGKYEYSKVPFGLVQAPAYFQNFMSKVLNGLNFTLAYLDDIIIFSETAEQHLKHIQILLIRLKQAKASVHFSKRNFTTLAIFFLQMALNPKLRR